jgi:hypothetical protein
MAVALLTVLLAAAPMSAGLVFVPVNTLPGADATALAASGTTLWAATPRGVWRLEAGAWTLDGLSARTITSIVVADAVYAADGEKVWKRGADGTWTAETLPGGLVFPSLLATDGTAVWAAGLGVAKRSSGTWAALGNPGGSVTAASVYAGDLVVGLRGGAAQYAGASVTPISTGLPVTSTVQTLRVANGALYAGTDQTLYTFAGTWTAVPGFGAHDVRAITDAGGTVRAATVDAGVLSKVGSWLATNTGLLVASAKSFATLGSDLYVGTAGAPIYRLSGSSWSAAGTGLYAASIAEVKTVIGATFVGAHGAGIAVVPGENFAPEGCGDVRAMAANSLRLFSATNCHLYAWPLGPSAFNPPSLVEDGLPPGVAVSSLAAVSDGSVAGGTPNAGMWRLVASTWSSDNAGLPANGSVLTAREVGGKLYASVGSSLFVRQQSAWQASSGAPAFVQALAGDSSVLFAAPVSGGISSSSGSWRQDDFGASTAFVSSLDADGRFAVAGAGTAGILRRTGGGWQPENAGLPAGADVRVVRRSGDAGNMYAGTAGHGLFLASTTSSAKYVPVVLDVTGATGARFRSDLTLGNRSTSSVTVTVGFVPAPDFGLAAGSSGSVSVVLSPSSELRAPDALQFLRDRGLAITPGPSGTAGSIYVAGDPQALPSDATDAVYVFSRTYTVGTAGSFGTFLEAPSDLEAAEDEGAIYGLRTVSGTSRSNLAVGHVPGRGTGTVTLSIQIYDQSGTASGAPLVTALNPGEWRQFNGVLGLAGLPDGAYGYAKITRTNGTGAWTAYGVVNDARTSDGSILPLYRPGGLAAGRELVVPVVLDVFGAAGSHYTTELTVANDGSFSTPVDLVYQPAPNFGSSTGVPVVTFTLAAHQQVTIADVLAYLRSKGVNIPDPSTGPQAGSLSVAFRNLGNLDTPKTVALARTTTPNTEAATGGAFGVAYAAAAKGGGARTSALVPGLARDASVRSNLAVVHLGGGSEIPLSLSMRLYDATTSQAVGIPVTVTLQPGDWTQWSSVFDVAGVPGGTTAAYAVVTRLSGDDTWLAYGVLNDAKTSDGSVLKMLPSAEY